MSRSSANRSPSCSYTAERKPTGPVAEAGTAHVNDRNGTTIVAAAGNDELEVVSLGLLDTPADLTPLLDRPRIRTVDALPGTLTDRGRSAGFQGWSTCRRV